ncbi:carbohydrate kinase [Maribrevibacterium harenarium]|uniref:Carbohydrate kinase n=1 Tax=Maribrevibacterium harenarium TaxID=2589817 RepID=A0A501X3C7_9GAMM|nr:FGGY-family carbohydrate kinase [Maribrevibacterium harenarium]TPE54974.1 carbohydrate kinase [Maribrevibacterium harenarium]
MTNHQPLIIGIDAGTSVIKAVAFSLKGEQILVASVRNTYHTTKEGAATQSLQQTWLDCAQAIADLGKQLSNFRERVVALAVTAQGDGTWLIDADGQPVTDAWLWLDGRAAPTVAQLQSLDGERSRFEATGTGLNTCQQGAQLAHMVRHYPELLDQAATAFHCKDWLYFNLTGIKATDPSEASFTFGDFRTRQYKDEVIAQLGLNDYRYLLPPIIDGSETTHPLSQSAAELIGLKAGIPVSLAYVDMVMTALGAGVHTQDDSVSCSVIGSTGVHMRSVADQEVYLNDAGTGYVIVLPVPGKVTQVQTNMASALNLDWLLNVASELLAEFGIDADNKALIAKIEGWLNQSEPGQLIYHPYISDAGERGPFVDANARASFTGVTYRHRYPDLVRAVIEGIGMAMRDCYEGMGGAATELRLSGGAARSAQLRAILAACVGADVRVSLREEAGAAGAAMMAAVANGYYPDMNTCIAEWVTPLLGQSEAVDPNLTRIYDNLYQAYLEQRQSYPHVWQTLAKQRDFACAANGQNSTHNKNDASGRAPDFCANNQ